MVLPSIRVVAAFQRNAFLRASTSADHFLSQKELVQRRRSSTAVSEKWVAVYRYPGIRGCQLLARAKFVQTIASVTYLPYSSYQFSLGAVDATWFSSTAVLAIAAPLLLAIFSRYINRLVGVVAMTEDGEKVRFGYLSFWGQRRNRIVSVEDVLPLSESGCNERDKVVRLSMYAESGTEYLFLPTENCEILDEQKAETLFGDLTVFEKKKKPSE